MHLHEILAAARRRTRALDGARIEAGGAVDLAVDVTAVECDSRRVGPGALFCCIPGARADGHDHAARAVGAGAVALLVERPLPLAVPQVVVASSRAAAGALASAGAGDPSDAIRVVGITGTNGKTTTAYLVEGIVRAAGERSGLIGTVEVRWADQVEHGEHTTPDACRLQVLLARMRDTGVTTVAMEVSSHALDQRRVDGTRFSVGCFTNLSQDHLDYHGSMAAYAAAKARLLSPELSALVAVNVDDATGRDLARSMRAAGRDVLTFGLAADAAVRAVDSRSTRDGTATRLVARDLGQTDLDLRLPGAFNLANGLAAAAVAILLGYPLATISAGIRSVGAVPGRMEAIPDPRGVLVFVDYAHTPDALVRVLATARSLAPAGRVIAVFGCGGDRDAAKRPLMGSAAAHASDLAVVTSDNPRSEDAAAIAAAVVSGTAGGPGAVVVELDRRAAIRWALGEARSGDAVIIAGKGHEAGQTTGATTVPFDDRVVAREVIAELAGWRSCA